jgi:hypothetical protein
MPANADYDEMLAEFSGMSDAELEEVERRFDAEVARARAQARTPPGRSPTPTRTPTPTPPPLGWGRDGVFRATEAQLRDPAWCFAHKAELQAISKEVANLPLSQVGERFVIL